MTIFDWQEPPGDPDGNGLYLRSRRGQIGENWWARRWLEPIEDGVDRQVLEVGRRLARRSQVLELHVQPGTVSARVEETREKTYVIAFRIPAIPDAAVQALLEQIGRDNLTIAHLYAGRIPEQLHETLMQAGLQLCPSPFNRHSCACGDAATCCHAVAAACIAAEHFDRDPFALLEFRGLTRLAVINAVRREWGADELRHTEQESVVPLTSLKQEFFHCPDELPKDSGALQLPPVDVLKLLGSPPFFPPGDHHMNQAVSDLYSE